MWLWQSCRSSDSTCEPLGRTESDAPTTDHQIPSPRMLIMFVIIRGGQRT